MKKGNGTWFSNEGQWGVGHAEQGLRGVSQNRPPGARINPQRPIW